MISLVQSKIAQIAAAMQLNQVFHCCLNNQFSSDLFLFFCRMIDVVAARSIYRIFRYIYSNKVFHCCLKINSHPKMFKFWFICISLQDDWRRCRSIHLSTNISKIIRQCSLNAHAPHGNVKLWKVQERRYSRIFSTSGVANGCSAAAAV